MADRVRCPWLARLLFRLTVGTSLLLLLLVFLAPLLDNGTSSPDGWRRVAALFAQDATLRRTAIASALGMLVTAGVFFRPSEAAPPVARKCKPSGPSPPPAGAAGA
jgi:hypothetical protein